MRFATKGEFPHVPTSRDDRRRLVHTGCQQSGTAVHAYYQPVVEFARKNLIDKDDGPVHERLVDADGAKPKLDDGVDIIVEPRGTVGELRIVHVGPPFYPPGDVWAGRVYCLHVLHSGATTTIAVEWQSRWIK